MAYRLGFSDQAKAQLFQLKATDEKKHRKVLKALGRLGVRAEGRRRLRVICREQDASAYRVLWYYKGRDFIQVAAITQHP